MKRLFPVLVAAFVWTSGFLSEAQTAESTRRTLEVLIVGNSFTYFNNLGDVLAGVAASLPDGPAIRPTLLVGGGMTLQWHYATGKPTMLVRDRKWDFVVLQEQSALGGGSEGGEARLSPPTVFHQAVRKFIPEIRKSGATPLLLMTWARRTRPDEQAVLTDAYMSIGRELNVQVSPAGLAWQEVLRKWPDTELHVADGSHPNPAGTYLTALVLYTSLTGRDPHGAAATIEGHPYSRREGVVDLTQTVTLVSLSPELARRLQDAAYRTSRQSRADR